LDRTPLIALVDRASRALQSDMVRAAHDAGFTELRYSHNAVFGTLTTTPARTVDLAARAGMTRQSMGEVVRDLVDLGILEMVPDPADGRAKLVRYTEAGLDQAHRGSQHIRDLEQRFADEFGEDYEAARRVLERITAILSEHGGQESPAAPMTGKAREEAPTHQSEGLGLPGSSTPR
jgi:DNA-binding MarR family transcriptional regulator